MKETKLVKRIFAGFVAFIVILLISCGDLQIFAFNQYTVTLEFQFRRTGSVNYNFAQQNGTSIGGASSTGSATKSFTVNSDGIFSISAWVAGNTFFANCTVNGYSISSYSTSSAYPSRDSVTVVPYSNTISISLSGSTGSSSIYRYFFFIFDDYHDATPTPEPTPTPVPTPTPEPTFNPDQPTYTTFFNHLLNDGNNALNALYLSWTQANNKFYTGIFFIGLPIMIGIFGIVASIFFGGDD